MDIVAVLSAISGFVGILEKSGFGTLVLAVLIAVGYKYIMVRIDKKYGLNETNIKTEREIQDKLDREENHKSKNKIAAMQRYLEKNQKDFFKHGIDRVSIFLSHNGKRNNDRLHFIYYSLICEVTNSGLERFEHFPIKVKDIPFFAFSEYEEKVLEGNGCAFVKDIAELGSSAKAIATLTGGKSMCIKGMFKNDGTLIGLIFGSSVYKHLDEIPPMQNHVNNLQLLYNSQN